MNDTAYYTPTCGLCKQPLSLAPATTLNSTAVHEGCLADFAREEQQAWEASEARESELRDYNRRDDE